MSNDDIQKALATFNWQSVINLIPNLQTLNDEQWRFIKGYIIELATEYSSNKELSYVGEHHRDFIWKILNLDVELKTFTSGTFYKKNGKLRKSFQFKLTNSNGTNNKNELTEDLICDIVIFIAQDGVAFVDKQTVIKNLKKNGDGFSLTVMNNDLIEVTGKMNVTEKKQIDFKKVIQDAITNELKKFF